jgi:hypothetical protein
VSGKNRAKAERKRAMASRIAQARADRSHSPEETFEYWLGVLSLKTVPELEALAEKEATP